MGMKDHEQQFCAHNYDPLPVMIVSGKGIWLSDDQGRDYLDMMSAYSAASHGHRHPRLVDALSRQASTLGIVSRAFGTNTLTPFLEKLCAMSGFEAALPMNTGSEAVETAIKAARRWGYEKKNVAPEKAEIIVADNNFHGRTVTIISFSSDAATRENFGPFTPGFKSVPFGDSRAVEKAITKNTVAVLMEPIQGEAGIRVPPQGWLKELRAVCSKHNVLMLIDEIQSGLGRTGKLFAFEHENIRPDGIMVGKALGGGLVPVSAFLAQREIMDVFTPGSHGSTFGGYPLAAAVGLEALNVIEEERLTDRSAELGKYLADGLRALDSPVVRDVRGKGLWVGVDIDPDYTSGRDIAERLLERGILSKETHRTTIRFAPPLIIERRDIDWALKQIESVLTDVERGRHPSSSAA